MIASRPPGAHDEAIMQADKNHIPLDGKELAMKRY
jgi:hypothetical protein